MIYLGSVLGGHGNTFMHLPMNIVFTSAHADFDEMMFPRCSNKSRQSQTNKPISQDIPPTIPTELDDNDVLPHQLPEPSPARKNNDSDDTAGNNQQVHSSVYSYQDPHSN